MADILEQQKAYYQARAVEYDEWWHHQGRYDKGEALNKQWRDEGQVVRDALHSIPERQHILELACGTGIWTQELVKLGEHVTCVDASSNMIKMNQAKVQSERVEYIEADLFQWQSEIQYDMIFFGFWLSHVPAEEYQAFLQRVSAMLKPEGYLFIIDSQRDAMGTANNQNAMNPDPVHNRILNDGREFQIIKVFYEPDALQSDLAQVNINADVRHTERFFIYAKGQKRSGG